jgi:hypothetical protein
VAVRAGAVKPVLCVTAFLVAFPVALPAQTYRTTVETRRVAADRAFRVDVTYGVGELVVHPGDAARTYRVGLTYAEDLFDPQVRYDPSANALTIKLAGEGEVNLDDNAHIEQVLDLALPPDVPLDLTLAFGALEADLDLGGLTLRSAEIKTGASETAVTFSRPARGACDRLAFNVGAAQFEATQLGNSGCRVISLSGAVGDMEMDFSGGHLAPETQVNVKVGLGEVRLRIPEHVGIRLESDRFLASVDRAGLVKQGSAYVSPDYDRATTKIMLDIDAALGSVEIERTR